MKASNPHRPTVVDFVGHNIELVGKLNTVVIATTPADLEAFCDALSAKSDMNAKGATDLFSRGRVRIVMSGTRADVTAASISVRLRLASIAVEIAGGPHDGLRGWCLMN